MTATKDPVKAGRVSTLTIYDATDAMLTVRRWIEENADAIIAAGGELPAELIDLLDKAEGDLATKAERTAFFLRELAETREAIKRSAKVLDLKAKALERAEDGLKKWYLLQFIRLGYNRVATKLGGLRVQRNSVPSIDVAQDFDVEKAYEAGELSEKFIRVEAPKPPAFLVDTIAVQDAFKVALGQAKLERAQLVAEGQAPADDTICEATLYEELSQRACEIAGFPASIRVKIGASLRLV